MLGAPTLQCGRRPIRPVHRRAYPRRHLAFLGAVRARDRRGHLRDPCGSEPCAESVRRGMVAAQSGKDRVRDPARCGPLWRDDAIRPGLPHRRGSRCGPSPLPNRIRPPLDSPHYPRDLTRGRWGRPRTLRTPSRTGGLEDKGRDRLPGVAGLGHGKCDRGLLGRHTWLDCGCRDQPPRRPLRDLLRARDPAPRGPCVQPGTLALAAAFGGSLAFAATYRSAKRASRLQIVETLRHYSPHEATVRYRPTLDVILVAVGVGTYVLDLTAFLVGPSLLGVLAGPLFFVMLPFAPFLLLIGLTRLLTRATPRFYQAAARLLRPFARNLHHLISQNLRRNPRRASNIALLIALGLAFGIFVLSLNSSFIVREVRILRASIGADMAGLSPIGDETFEDNVTRVAGVAAVTSILPIPALPSLSPPTYSRPDLFALDPRTFFATTAPEPWYFLDGDPGPAQRVLSTAGEVLVSEGFMEDAFLEVRDPLRLVYSDQEGDYLDVTIGGGVRGFPPVFSSPHFLS